MESHGNQDLEDAAVEEGKPPRKRKPRWRKKPKQQTDADDFNPDVEDSAHAARQSLSNLCLSGVPSYQPLPIPPLGSSAIGQVRSGLNARAYRSSPDTVRYQPLQRRGNQGQKSQLVGYHHGQDLSWINKPEATIEDPRNEAVQSLKPPKASSNAVGVKRYNLRPKFSRPKSDQSA